MTIVVGPRIGKVKMIPTQTSSKLFLDVWNFVLLIAFNCTLGCDEICTMVKFTHVIEKIQAR
ncbi:hypothetical protein D3C78_1893200 [compost metagenome]